MKFTKSSWAAVGASLLLAACGGGGDGNQAPKVKFSAMVSFGDSLSDVGSYAVGDALTAGGGKFTVNGITTDTAANPASKNWTERIAAQLGLPAPCAAQTGLAGSGWLTPTAGPVAPVFHSGCYNYAQGGARVIAPTGPVNIANGDDTSLKIGALTVPVVTKIQNHLNAVTNFSGTELVTVMAGANDVLQLTDDLKKAATAAGTAAGAAAGGAAFASSLIGQLAAGATDPVAAAQAIGLAFQTEVARPGSTTTTRVGAAVTAAAGQPGNSAVASASIYGPMVATAQAAGAAAGATAGAAAGAAYGSDPANAGPLVVAMGTAGAQLANLVKTQILGKGAKYVAVLNLPDVSLSPASKAQPAATQGLIHLMVTTFNAQLKAGLAGTPNVIVVDIYANIVDQVTNPSGYGLTNVTGPACDEAKEILVSSMLCTKDTLMAGDVSHYLFAEKGGHPTPFELKLIASVVARDLAVAGWL
jgi:phospholipase/lecithinase/hemolysin